MAGVTLRPFPFREVSPVKEDKSRYELFPITLRDAKEFVDTHHRHNSAPQGHKFSIGIKEDGRIIGVVVVGRPIAKPHDNGYTAEITRCCVLADKRNANSMLYAAACRAARAMGYRRILTYTLPHESGVSLRAVGFYIAAATRPAPNGWGVPSRPREMAIKYPAGDKLRWEKRL